MRELQRAIIYTRELSKQAIEGHVSTASIVYSVNEGARLTKGFGLILKFASGGARRAIEETVPRTSSYEDL